MVSPIFPFAGRLRSRAAWTWLLAACAHCAAAQTVASAADGGPAPKPASRPNVVLILADDVGCDAIGCYGGESYPTPQIDKLAQRGVRFDHCYSMPSCHPTRTCLLTGKYPRRIGNPRWGSFPQDEEPHTIAQLFRRGGYATAVAGKWQLSLLSKDLEQPHRMGFQRYSLFGWHEGPRYYQPLIFQQGKVRQGLEDRYGPDVYCEFLIDFMEENRARPFFAFYPMALCHDVTDDLDQPVPYGPRGRYDSYAEMMAEMDRVVGKLVAAVDRLGLAERTLILFTGDNGTPAGSIIRAEGGKYLRDPVYSIYRGKKVRGGKTKLTDGGTHVPLLAVWKGVAQPGTVRDDLVDFSDFLPTFAELIEQPLEATIQRDGVSFAHALRQQVGPAATRRQWAYAEAGKRYWVRSQRYKLYNDGAFHDLQQDVEERRALDTKKLGGEAQRTYQELQRALDLVAFP